MKLRIILLTAVLVATLPETGQATDKSVATHEQASSATQFLFVQNASSGTYSDGRLSLVESGPVIFFSDRPYRLFGHTRAQRFVDSWGTGENNFAQNPPNAVLSVLGEEVVSIGLVLTNASYDEGIISYQVTVEEGTIPARFNTASLFIDNEGWAAVGGLLLGRHIARRQAERESVAYSMGQDTTYVAASTPVSPTATAEQQLEQLKQMLDQKLITAADYDKKKQEILRRM